MEKFGSWAFYALVVAAILTFMTVSDYRKGAALKKEGVETEGRIVEIQESRGRRGRVTYTPVVAFTDQEGNSQTLKTDGSSSNHHSVGQTVQIVYLASNPSVGDMADNDVSGRAGFFMWICGGAWLLTLVFGGLYLKGRMAA